MNSSRVISSLIHFGKQGPCQLLKQVYSASLPRLASTNASQSIYSAFETLKIEEVSDHVLNVELNRPKVRNAMNPLMFDEIKAAFDFISEDGHIRSVVLTGAGKLFSAGLDLMSIQESLFNVKGSDYSRKTLNMRGFLRSAQESMHAVYKCQKPVIAAVQPGCIGAGINMVSAADIKYCSKDAWFTIKEVDLGLAADIGAIQWMPKTIGNGSLFAEVLYTARRFDANEAKEMGLVSRILEDIEATKAAAFETAKIIAEKSPVAVRGSKHNLLYSRDHSVDDGLNYMATWNAAMLQSEDILKAAASAMSKDAPIPSFDDLN